MISVPGACARTHTHTQDVCSWMRIILRTWCTTPVIVFILIIVIILKNVSIATIGCFIHPRDYVWKHTQKGLLTLFCVWYLIVQVQYVAKENCIQDHWNSDSEFFFMAYCGWLLFNITNEIGQQLCHKCCFFCSNSVIKSLFFRLDLPVRMRSPERASQSADCFYSNRYF